MSEEANADAGFRALLGTPLKLSEFVLAGTVIFYVAGFAITNLYFGSLGIVSFDVLRARYLLTGFLFAVFVGLSAFLVYGLVLVLREHREDASLLRLFADIVFYSLTRFAVVSFCVAAIVELSGSTSSPPVGLPSATPPLPWSEWFSGVPAVVWSAVRQGGGMLLAGLVLILLVLVVFLVINPKMDEDATSYRKWLLRRATSLKFWKSIGLLLTSTLAFYVTLNVFTSLIRFLTRNEVTIAGGSSERLLSSAVVRFTGAVFGLYGLAGALLIFVKLGGRLGTETKGDPTSLQAAGVLWAAMLIGMVLPLYSLGVYPSMSQQVGGGRMVPVEVLTSNERVSEWLGATSVDAYLIDRASKSSLFLIVDSHSRRIVEVANSELQAITYSRTWLGSQGRHP
jgi:hypothetical protein